MKKTVILFLVLLALCAGGPSVHAQRPGGAGPAVSAGPFGALRWRSAWAAAWRPFHRGRRQRGPAARVLHGRHGRRTLENHRRRQQLATGHRCHTQEFVGRRDRDFAVESRRRLRRHRRIGNPRQHHPRRWRIQVDRWRQNLGAHGADRNAGHCENPRSPDESRPRVCRRIRPPCRTKSGARSFPVERRRQVVGQDPFSR